MKSTPTDRIPLPPARRNELAFELIVAYCRTLTWFVNEQDAKGLASKLSDKHELSYPHLHTLFRFVLDYNDKKRSPAALQRSMSNNNGVSEIVWKTLCILIGFKNGNVDVDFLRQNLDAGFSWIKTEEGFEHLSAPLGPEEMIVITYEIEQEVALPSGSLLWPLND